MAKKTHPADLADRAKVETATHFNVHLRRSPTDKINREAATLRAAIKIADELSVEGGKPAMIYAITPDQMTVFVPKDMIDAERAQMAQDAADDEAMKKPLTGGEIAQLSAIITGGGMKRSNSRAAAEARFRKLAADAGIEEAKVEDLLAGPMHFAELVLRERVSGKPMTIPEAQAARNGAAPAKAGDYPPSVGKATARKAAVKLAAEAAPAAKPERQKKAASPKAERPAGGKRAAILEAAQRGEMPAAPDFSAETHKRFRPTLAKLIELAEAGDIKGLKAVAINPVSSSPKAMAKYRDLAVIALEAQKTAAKKAAA